MPNWVRNNVVVSGNVEKIQKFVNECIETENRHGEKVAFTFDKVIPMAKSLNIERSTDVESGMLVVCQWRLLKIVFLFTLILLGIRLFRLCVN